MKTKDQSPNYAYCVCLLWAHKYSKMGQTSSKKQSQTAVKMNNKKKTSVFSLDSSEVEAGNNKPIESLFFFF